MYAYNVYLEWCAASLSLILYRQETVNVWEDLERRFRMRKKGGLQDFIAARVVHVILL